MIKTQFALLFAIYFATDVWSATTRRPRATTTTTVAKPIGRITTTTKRPTTKITTTPPNTDSSYPFCRNYNKIKKDLLESSLSDDFVAGKRDLVLELLDPRPIPQGFLRKRGNRIFFDSIEKVDHKAAVEACLYRKMQLLALDTPGEIDDKFVTMNWKLDDDTQFNDTSAYMEFLWTSAVPCSKSDPLNKTTNSCSSVTWCSSKVESRLDYTLNLGKFSPPYCLIYKWTTKQLEPTNCSFGSLFMCELSCSKPTCPSEKMCIKDESLFELKDGKTYLKTGREIRGKWEKSNKFNSSYRFYFLGEKMVTWTENWKTCCSLGLKPLSLGQHIFHFDRYNSPMQGLVFWTAMTRAGCQYQFENCFQESTEFPLRVYGLKEGGSCVAISVHDSSAIAMSGTGLAAKTMVCATKLLMACEGPAQTFEVREKIFSCDLPECTGIPDCVMDDSKFLTRPARVLLNPQRFGQWTPACDTSFLLLRNELGTWDEAYKRCCSHGMDLMSIQNPSKQYCMNKVPTLSIKINNGRLPFKGHIWTSGRDLETYCRGKLRWCTGYLNDYLKKDIVWKKGVDPKSANNSCVYIDFDEPDVPSLGLADCSEKKQILCEAPAGVSYRSQMHSVFCRNSFSVKQSEASKIWNTGDISRAGYNFKKMVQCLAEHLGLVYDSTKINEHVYLSMMSRVFFRFNQSEIDKATQDLNGLVRVLPRSNSTIMIMKILTETTDEVMDEFLSGHFQLATEMIRKLIDCRHTAKTNEETFAFDFLMCLVESKGLDRFWSAYNFELEGFSVIPMVDEFYSPCSTFQNFLQNMSLCIPTDLLAGLGKTGIFISTKPINVRRFRTSSYTACLERNGSLPYAETKEIFYYLYFFIRNQAPNLTIIWDQAYMNNIGGFAWCASDYDPYNLLNHVAVPVDVIKEVSGNPLMLVSLPGSEPNLHAVPVTGQLKYETDVFCRFYIDTVEYCLSNPGLKRWEY